MLQLSLTPALSPAIAPILTAPAAGSADFALALAGVSAEPALLLVPVPATPLPPDRQFPADIAEFGDGALSIPAVIVPGATAPAPAVLHGDTTPKVPTRVDSTGAVEQIVPPSFNALVNPTSDSVALVPVRARTTFSDAPSPSTEHDDGADVAPLGVPQTGIELPPIAVAIAPIPVTALADPDRPDGAPLVSTLAPQPAPLLPSPLAENAEPALRSAALPAVTSNPATPPVVSRSSDNVAGPIVGLVDQAIRGTASTIAGPPAAPFVLPIGSEGRAPFIDSIPVSISQSAAPSTTGAGSSAAGSVPALPRPAQPPEIGIPVPALRAFAAAIAATRAPAPTTLDDDDSFSAPIATIGQPETNTRPADLPSRPLPPLDMRRDDWTRALIDRIDAVRDVANARDTRITLVPDALGKIEVALRQEGETVHVAFTADAPATRALLADAQPRLAELAEARGLRLGDTAVLPGTEGNRHSNNFGQSADQRRPAPSPQGAATNRSPTTNAATDGADSDNRIA